jgi:hypothetical protein
MFLESYLPIAEENGSKALHYIVYAFTLLAGLANLFSKVFKHKREVLTIFYFVK